MEKLGEAGGLGEGGIAGRASSEEALRAAFAWEACIGAGWADTGAAPAPGTFDTAVTVRGAVPGWPGDVTSAVATDAVVVRGRAGGGGSLAACGFGSIGWGGSGGVADGVRAVACSLARLAVVRAIAWSREVRSRRMRAIPLLTPSSRASLMPIS